MSKKLVLQLLVVSALIGTQINAETISNKGPNTYYLLAALDPNQYYFTYTNNLHPIALNPYSSISAPYIGTYTVCKQIKDSSPFGIKTPNSTTYFKINTFDCKPGQNVEIQ